jgi:ureidoglycolate hydrolase
MREIVAKPISPEAWAPFGWLPVADTVVVVAPPAVQMTVPDDADEARAFLLEPLQSIVLYRGTWHWGPFPLKADSVELFNIQGRRYLEDNDCADLLALGASLEVRLGG